MRRCATIAAITLCGAVAAGTTSPAFAAVSEPPPVGGHALVQDRRDADDDFKTELATWMSELNKIIADDKKELEADIKAARKDIQTTIEEGRKDMQELQKEFADWFKELKPPTPVPTPG